MNRRDMLTATLATITGATLAPTIGRAIEPFPKRNGNLKLSLAAYSLRDALTGKTGRKMDMMGFLDYCASLGLDGAELTAYYFAPERTREYANQIKRKAHVLGLSISGGAIGNDFCVTGEALEKEFAKAEQWIQFYAELGAPAIRVFAGKTPKGDTENAARGRCIDALKRACDVAGKYGVMLALENHGGITATAKQLLAIVTAVDSPWFGVNFDSGNFHSEDPYAELEQIAPYAVNAQIKVDMNRAGKHEETDLKRIIGILKNAGYSGWLALEYEAKADPFTAIPSHVATLRKLLTTG